MQQAEGRGATQLFSEPAGAADEEDVNRAALEAGFLHGRVVWFDPYPFIDDVVLDASAKDTPRWRRRQSWELYRLAHDWRWYLRNNHCVLSVLLSHPLNPLTLPDRLVLLVAQAAFTAAVVAMMLGGLLATEAETIQDISDAEASSAPVSRLTMEVVVTVETVVALLGAIAGTVFEQAAKLAALPPCAPPEVRHGLAPHKTCRCCPKLKHAGIWGSLAVALGLLALALLALRTDGLLVHTANALATSYLLSAVVDSAAFFALRQLQLDLFGRPNAQRVRLYPFGLERPGPSFLWTTQAGYAARPRTAPPPPRRRGPLPTPAPPPRRWDVAAGGAASVRLV